MGEGGRQETSCSGSGTSQGLKLSERGSPLFPFPMSYVYFKSPMILTAYLNHIRTFEIKMNYSPSPEYPVA